MEDKFSSNPFQVKEFIEGFVWKDMKYLIEDIREGVRNDLETEESLEEIYRSQGRAQMATLMLNMPDTLLSGMEMDTEEKVELSDEPEKDLEDMYDLDV